jgi:hypothetical protein
MVSIKDKNLVGAASEHLFMSRFLSKNVGIGKFVLSSVPEDSISKHLQKSYFDKIRNRRLQKVTPENCLTVQTLVSSYYKIQNSTGFRFFVTLRIGSLLCK